MARLSSEVYLAKCAKQPLFGLGYRAEMACIEYWGYFRSERLDCSLLSCYHQCCAHSVTQSVLYSFPPYISLYYLANTLKLWAPAMKSTPDRARSTLACGWIMTVEVA